MRPRTSVLFCLVLPLSIFFLSPGAALAQSDCSGPGALIYDDGLFENALGTSSTTAFVHIAQLMELDQPTDRVTSLCFCFSSRPGGNPELTYDVAIWSAAGNAPDFLLATVSNIDGGTIPEFPGFTWRRVNLTDAFSAGDDFFIGPVWDNEDIFLCTDESVATPLQPAYIDIDAQAGQRPPVAQLGVDLSENFRAAGIRTIAEEAPTDGLDQATLVVPGFDYDTQAPDGRTTFFSIGNHLDTMQSVAVSYYGNDVTGDPVASNTVMLAPRQTQPIDIRNVGLDELAGGDGIARGLVLIGEGPNDDISGDFQRVNFASDFATGDRLVRTADFCDTVRHRFLDFGGGTQFQILLNRPPEVGASFGFTAYDEDGNVTAIGARSPGTNLFTTTAADLDPFTNFGSIVFDLSASEGGAVSAEYAAFGRFSLESDGECLDAQAFGVRFTPHEGETPEKAGPFAPGLLKSMR